MVRNGNISVKIGAKYALIDAVQAHKDLEGRKTSGCIVLMP
jgi:NADPH2:quinone reductase